MTSLKVTEKFGEEGKLFKRTQYIQKSVLELSLKNGCLSIKAKGCLLKQNLSIKRKFVRQFVTFYGIATPFPYDWLYIIQNTVIYSFGLFGIHLLKPKQKWTSLLTLMSYFIFSLTLKLKRYKNCQVAFTRLRSIINFNWVLVRPEK